MRDTHAEALSLQNNIPLLFLKDVDLALAGTSVGVAQRQLRPTSTALVAPVGAPHEGDAAGRGSHLHHKPPHRPWQMLPSSHPFWAAGPATSRSPSSNLSPTLSFSDQGFSPPPAQALSGTGYPMSSPPISTSKPQKQGQGQAWCCQSQPYPTPSPLQHVAHPQGISIFIS